MDQRAYDEMMDTIIRNSGKKVGTSFDASPSLSPSYSPMSSIGQGDINTASSMSSGSGVSPLAGMMKNPAVPSLILQAGLGAYKDYQASRDREQDQRYQQATTSHSARVGALRDLIRVYQGAKI